MEAGPDKWVILEVELVNGPSYNFIPKGEEISICVDEENEKWETIAGDENRDLIFGLAIVTEINSASGKKRKRRVETRIPAPEGCTGDSSIIEAYYDMKGKLHLGSSKPENTKPHSWSPLAQTCRGIAVPGSSSTRVHTPNHIIVDRVWDMMHTHGLTESDSCQVKKE